jgi:hypothetical protein
VYWGDERRASGSTTCVKTIAAGDVPDLGNILAVHQLHADRGEHGGVPIRDL